jgi:hypothetical protein
MFIAGCSAVWKADYLTPLPENGALRVQIFDWETELYGGPSIGSYRPKIYGYKLNDNYVFVYPREISNGGSIGPPLIPIGPRIPEVNNDYMSFFNIRVFDPKNNYDHIPTKISLFNNKSLETSCELFKAEKDLVGIEFLCNEIVSFPTTNPTHIIVEFNDMSQLQMNLKLVTVRGYSPLFSFNGPNPKPVGVKIVVASID